MKIAIVRLSAMGDIIQSMVVLQFIKKRFPHSTIDWFVDSKFADLLDDCKEVDQVIEINSKNIKSRKSLYLLVSELKKIRQLPKYDKVFDLQGLVKSALVSRVIRSDERIGFDKKSIRESFASYFYTSRFYFPYHANVIDRYIGLVSFGLNMSVSKKEISEKKPFFFGQKKYINRKPKLKIALILGASFPSKVYPVEKYAEIVNAINARFFAVFHSESEEKMARKLNSITNKTEMVYCKNIRELKKIISDSEIIIGGDTGPTHLAWGFNKASITIFGSTPIERNFFPTKVNLAVTSNTAVDPYKVDKYDSSIQEINPNEIISLIKKISNYL